LVRTTLLMMWSVLMDVLAMWMSRATVPHIGPELEDSVEVGMLGTGTVFNRRQEESQCA
jgi:hypothetical protein